MTAKRPPTRRRQLLGLVGINGLTGLTGLSRLTGLLSAAAALVSADLHAQPATPAPTTPPELATDLPGATWRGSAVMRFIGMQIYDIRLWSPAALPAETNGQPLALELVYARKLVGELIASRSIDEMRRIGPFTETQAATWLAAMNKLFPNVQPGDRLTGVQLANGSTRFYFNGQRQGDVADAEFTRLFFGIWLSPRTSEPRLREQLLGGGR